MLPTPPPAKTRVLLQHPVNGLVVAEVMSLHRGHGMGGTWTPRGAFPRDSRGNFQPQDPQEEQQPVRTALPLLPFSPCPKRGDIPSPGDGSFLHPPCHLPARKSVPTTSRYLRNEQTKPTRPYKAGWGCAWRRYSRWGRGRHPPGCWSHCSSVHPEIKDYTSQNERLYDWKNHPTVKPAELFAGTF